MTDLVLSGLIGLSVVVYIDDILIWSATFTEHVLHLRQVFDRLLQANLKVKPSKCSFALSQVTFLGHVVSSEGIKPDEKKILAIKNFPRPKDVTGVKRALGIMGYYRHHIENFAQIAKPLHNLLRVRTPFEWTSDCEQAFTTLQEKLMTYPVLAHPDFTKHFIIETDASLTGLGAVLSQEQDDLCVHPIAYASRSLQDAETRYSISELEILCVDWSLRYFRPYVYGREIHIFCDQASVRYALVTNNLRGRQARWGIRLQEYNLKLFYRPGKMNANADALSRVHDQPKPIREVAQEIKVVHAHHTEEADHQTSSIKYLEKLQREDTQLIPIILYLEQGILPTENPNLAMQVLAKSSRYHLQEGILFCTPAYTQKLLKHRLHGRPVPNLLVVPQSLQPEVLEAYHCELGGGHFGIDRTIDKISLRYYWPNLKLSVAEFCKSCLGCLTRKAPTHSFKGPLTPIPVEPIPFFAISIDVVGPLPMTTSGNKYLITAICMFTSWPEVAATADTKAPTVARFLFDYIICRHGSPNVILSDLGSNLMSQLIQEVCKLTDTKRAHTVRYRAMANGRLERYHKSLMTTLSMYVSTNQRDWDLYISLATLAYRCSRHESTGEIPYFLVHGRDIRLPLETAFQLPNPDYVVDVDDFKLDLVFRLRSAWKIAHECISKAQQKQKYYHDKRLHLPPNYQPNDLVFVYTPAVPKGRTAKLSHLWHLHQVTECRFPNLLVVPCNNPRARPKLVNVDQVKPGPPDLLAASSLPPLRHLSDQEEEELSNESAGLLGDQETAPPLDITANIADPETIDSSVDQEGLEPSQLKRYKLRPRPIRS